MKLARRARPPRLTPTQPQGSISPITLVVWKIEISSAFIAGAGDRLGAGVGEASTPWASVADGVADGAGAGGIAGDGAVASSGEAGATTPSENRLEEVARLRKRKSGSPMSVARR